MKTKEELIKLMFESTKTEGSYYQSVDLSDRIVVTYRIDGLMRAKQYTNADFTTFIYNVRNTSDSYGALDMD